MTISCKEAEQITPQKAKYLWQVPKMNSLERSSCGWSTRLAGLSSAPSSARCVTYSKSRILCSHFLFGENDDNDHVYSQQNYEWVCNNLHFRMFLILCRKYIANITIWALFHPINQSKLTQMHQKNLNPPTGFLTFVPAKSITLLRNHCPNQSDKGETERLFQSSTYLSLPFTFL